MSTRLVILGLLKEKPLYGYELKSIIEHYMGDWTNIAFGSIYFALRKLTEEGLVREVAVEQEKGRPSRRVYELTEDGRNEFLSLLRAAWLSEDHLFFPFDIALFFLKELPRKERTEHIRKRLTNVRRTLAYLDGHEKEMRSDPRVPAVAAAIFSHTRHHTRAELAWLEEVLHGIESDQL
ncbi:PadR family transcriptional regulator [Marispirochaeta sp.]|jgi:DNA-binding PadR family transcriptional regulator|uniref:PadR family transcriptional regulator n=1 Tax=Marispirochaeta sp. TaxID=2038653 RepID=UPI0029C68777|nr:PadR family transcriptional regulator [Marispirochaeta sp.]